MHRIGPLHEILHQNPLFGDSTNNQAIVFSPVLASAPPLNTPSYPNYTLPSADSSLPSAPGSTPNVTLIVTQSSNKPLLRTSCFLNSSAISTTGTIVNSSLWLRDPDDGWRTQWLLSGLTPQTNYTAFVIQDTHKVSGPINFLTKSASFICTLVHSLAFCPSTAYAVPLPAPSSSSINNFPIYDSSNLPGELSSQIVVTLTNFTVSLTTLACGRDLYSPIVGCDDCQREYRKWLCATLLPRCSEPSSTNPNFITPDPGGVGTVNAGPGPSQAVLSALSPVPSQTPTPGQDSPYIQAPYTQLLPCVELCTAVDRACPPFLQFRCPKSEYNGAASYGFGYVDGSDGSENGGLVKSAHDRWGNVWCNAG
jgi:calcium channel MID1